MNLRLHRTSALTGAVEYAYAASTDSPRLVFTAGACPLDESGVVPDLGFAEQAALCMQNLAVVLTEAGAALQTVLKTTVYVASSDRADLVAAWQSVRAAMGEHDAPSTLLGVVVLGYPGQLVEVEAIAVGRGTDEV